MKNISRFSIVVLVFVALTFLVACKRDEALPEMPQNTTDDSETAEDNISATLSEIMGSVLARQFSDEDFAEVDNGYVLQTLGKVQTMDDSKVRLDLSDDSLVRLGANTSFTLGKSEKTPDGWIDHIRIEIGELWIILNGGALEVDTPSGLASVRGSYLSVSYDEETGEVEITCLEGDCTLSNGTETVQISAGETAIITGSGQPPQTGKMDDADVQDWLDNVPEATLVVPHLTATAQTFTPTETSSPTGTATPTDTATPTGTSTPTDTPTPTNTVIVFVPIVPSDTPIPPSDTPIPPSDTPTPTDAALPVPDLVIDSISPSPSIVGELVTFTVTAQVSASQPIPTGTVQILREGEQLCNIILNGSGSGFCNTTFFNTGSYNIQAFYLGDDDYGTTYSISQEHMVSASLTNTSLDTNIPNPSVVGETVTVTFSVTAVLPGGGTPYGNVTVSDGVDSCMAAVSAGQCDLIFNAPSTNKVLQAAYGGNPDYLASVSSPVAHVVTKADTTTTIQSHLPNPSLVGGAVTFEATVDVDSPGSGTPTGSVSFTNGVDSCVATSAPWSCDINFASTGPQNVTASYSGDSNFNGSVSTSVIHHVATSSNSEFLNDVGPNLPSFEVMNLSDCTQFYSVDVLDVDDVISVYVEYILNDDTFMGSTTRVLLTNTADFTWSANISIPGNADDLADWRFISVDSLNNENFFGGGTVYTNGYPGTTVSSYRYPFDSAFTGPCPVVP